MLSILLIQSLQRKNLPNKCLIHSNITEEQAFDVYKSCYNSNDMTKQNFKDNYLSFKNKMNNLNNNTTLPEILGYNMSQLLNYNLGRQIRMAYQNRNILQNSKKNVKVSIDCQEILCTAKDPLIHNFSTLPSSVDLFTQGLVTSSKQQGNCGSCWAFSTIAALESCILHDTQSVKSLKFWENEVQNGLDLSEQFQLSNTFGFSNYCEGGDFVMAMNYMAAAGFPVELEKNFPYQYIKHWIKHLFRMPLQPIIAKEDRIQPFMSFPNTLNGVLKTPVVEIFYHPVKSFDKHTINVIKSYLAQGIPIVAAMYVNFNNMLLNVQGKIPIEQKCHRQEQNHQVVIVGYETLQLHGKNTECWKVKNSWGDTFGDNGFFYVPIGNNDYCLEQYAFALIPQHFFENDEEMQLKNVKQGIQKLNIEDLPHRELNKTEPYDYRIYLAAYMGFAASVSLLLIIIYSIVERCRHRRQARRRTATRTQIIKYLRVPEEML